MITLKDYAKQHNVTYEAIRSQVNRYREQLGDHIIQDGRQQFLDDYAVAFLDERRQKNPVVVHQQSKDEAYEQVRQELEVALKTIANLQQFKIATLESRQALEDAKTAQERRERELDKREGQMDQIVSEAVQKASEDTRKAVEEEKNKEIAQIQQKATDERTAAQKAFDEDLSKKDGRIQELVAYAAAQKARADFFALPWFKRIGKTAPIVPELQEDEK